MAPCSARNHLSCAISMKIIDDRLLIVNFGGREELTPVPEPLLAPPADCDVGDPLDKRIAALWWTGCGRYRYR